MANTSLRNLEKPCFLRATVTVSMGEEITWEDYWVFFFLRSNLLLFSIPCISSVIKDENVSFITINAAEDGFDCAQ